MSESKWNRLSAKISEGAYVSPGTLRNDYAHAMAEACFKVKRDEKQQRIQAILDHACSANIHEEKINAIKVLITRKKVTSPEKIVELLKRKNETTNCTDGEHCEPSFKEIG